MKRWLVGACVATAFVGTACSSSPSAPPVVSPTGGSHGQGHHRAQGDGQSPIPTESPVPIESNPPGDIPDSTRFPPYHSSKGAFTLKVPEGWSRRTTGSSVSFSDKLNSITVQWFAASKAPTVAGANSKEVPQLRRTERAFSLKEVLACAPTCTIPYTTNPIDVHLPSGQAVVIRYFDNSAPNSVTGKQYRDEVVRFEFFKKGTEAALILAGPVGSDNVDPWRLVSESFAWS